MTAQATPTGLIDLQRVAKKVLTSCWRHQVEEWDQGRWESCIQEGSLFHEEAPTRSRSRLSCATGSYHLFYRLAPLRNISGEGR